MKRKINLFLLLLLLFPCMVFMSACGTQSVKFNIKFMVDNEVYSTIQTGGNETITMPENPTKDGYTFDGWYWDENIWGQPFTANSLLNAPLSSDMKVYAKFTYIHTHNLTKIDKKVPTCTENGCEEYYICECGKMFSDENGTTEINKINILSAIGHTFCEWYEVKPASYTEKGTERRDCSICGYYETRDIEKLVVEIVDPTELNVEYGILKWNGSSPYGFNVVVNGESQKVFGNSLETSLKSDDYNSVSVACIYENETKSNNVELNNFVVNAPISNLHFIDDGTNVTFIWDSESELYDYTFVVSGQETTISKNQKTYTISRNSVAAETEISVYVNGVDSANFKPSKKTTIKLEQLDHPNLSINKLDVEWENVENSEYYLVKGLTNITTTDTKYSYDGASSGNYTITVEVYASDYLFNSSTLIFKKLIKPNISIANNVVSWDAIAGQVRYATLFNNKETKFSANSVNLEDTNTEYEMLLYALPVQANEMQSDIVIIKQFIYEEYSNIYWGNIIKNEISYSKVMPSEILYVPECCPNVDFSSINNQNLTLISNKRPDSLKSSLIANFIIPTNVTSIQSNAFRDCNNLTSIVIPNNVASIGSSAFSGCSSLTNITIPNGVTSIGNYAFCGCTNIVSLNIPSSVKTIGASAFENCSGLTAIDIKNGVTTIGEKAFSNCTGLTSLIMPNSIINIGFNALQKCNSLETLSVPFVGSLSSENTYLGYLFGAKSYTNNPDYVPNSLKTITITGDKISDTAFYGCSDLVSITISNNVVSIGSSAFENCSNLENIIFEENSQLTGIYKNAFSGCSSLTNITIPNSVTIIGNYAFYNCSNLTSVIVPDNVSTISVSMFQKCISLSSINIPDGVTSIESGAFLDCSNLTSIIIPNSVKKIGMSAFTDCIRLTSITIPNSLLEVDIVAFNRCSGLKEVHISNLEAWLNISFGSDTSNPLYYAHHLYLNNVELTEITIPDSVTEIKDFVLLGANSITSITISNNTASIGKSSFEDCSNVTSIIVPNNVITIGEYAFAGCTKLTSITLSTKLITIRSYAFKGCGNLTAIDIPDSVKDVYPNAFEDCSKLTSIVIPNSITIIYCDTFYNCNGLTSITIPSSVTDIGMYAFYGCENLKEVYISNLEAWFNISFGGQYANPLYYAHHLYLNGTELTEITIPDTITEIKYCALEGASAINSVVIPKSVTSIGWRAFAGCSGLTQVIIPDGVSTIDRYAFADCTSLTSLTIPNSVISVGNDALYGCTSLETLSIPFVGGSASANTYLGYIFGATSSSSHSSYVPNSLKNVIVTGDTISRYAFYNCTNTISIIIPTSIKNVGEYAFYNCSNFTIYCEETSEPSNWNSYWKSSNCSVFWYRETQPIRTGNYWHYVDGVVTKW